MALETPPTPVYGTETFESLAELARIVKSNDDELESRIDAIEAPEGVSQAFAPVALASGYSVLTGYQVAEVTRTGRVVTLTAGLLNCPASISAGAWLTIATIASAHAAFRPAADAVAVGSLRYGSGGQDFVNVRVTSGGAVQMLPWDAYGSASYVTLPSGLSWVVAA